MSTSLSALTSLVDKRFSEMGLSLQSLDGSTTLGNNSAAGLDSTAIGDSAMANGPNDTAIGYHATDEATGGVAVGAGATIKAGANFATAIGYNATVTASNGTALGSNAAVNAVGGTAIGSGAVVRAGATNAVAIGAGSVASDPNTVSVGSPGNERRIENVAPGINGADAANVNQVNQAEATANAFTDTRFNLLSNRLGSAQAHANAGIAGALAAAFMPPPITPGKGALSIGVGAFNGQAGVSWGFSYRFNDNRASFKAGLDVTSQGDTGGGAGFSWEF